LEERSTHRVLGCFLGVGDRDDFEKEVLVDEAVKRWVCFILEGHSKTRDGSFLLLLRVRLKSLFLYLSYTVAFAVIFPVAVINSYYQSIHVLEQGRFFLFPDRDRILNLIGEPLVIAMAEYTILLT